MEDTTEEFIKEYMSPEYLEKYVLQTKPVTDYIKKYLGEYIPETKIPLFLHNDIIREYITPSTNKFIKELAMQTISNDSMKDWIFDINFYYDISKLPPKILSLVKSHLRGSSRYIYEYILQNINNEISNIVKESEDLSRGNSVLNNSLRQSFENSPQIGRAHV